MLISMIALSSKQYDAVARSEACQNQNSSLVKRQNDNIAPGTLPGEGKSLALTREVNLDTQTLKSSFCCCKKSSYQLLLPERVTIGNKSQPVNCPKRLHMDRELK